MYKTFTPRCAGFLLALFLVLLPSVTHAQFIDNKGTDFYMAYLPNADNLNTNEVHLTADVATNVTIQFPANAPTFDVTVAVMPGDITVVELPIDASEGWRASPGTPLNNVVRAFAPAEFVAYMINRRQVSSDAGLALPVDALNTDYLVQTYIPSFTQFIGGEFIVVAAFDNTEVTITPTQDLASGETAGTPTVITLDRGEGWAGFSASTIGSNGDLTGSLIEATKPVAMTNGNGATQVPPGTTAADHMFEVAQPLASWGTSALVSPLPNRPSGSVYRILAAEDNTTVEQNGSVIGTIDSGEFLDTGVIPGAHVFDADKPIFVTQFMTGVSFSGATLGDPAQGNMIPSEQYLSAYTFSTVGGGQFAEHFLSVIAENDDVNNGTILLDGAAIPMASFTPIAGTNFSYATLPLSEGTHTTSSGGVHGITVEGYNAADSYVYPGGARFQFINQGEDDTPPVCDGSLDGTTFFGSATDLLSADPDNQGIFFVALGDGSVNLTLTVDPFTPGDETVTYQVMRTDPSMDGEGSVVATDGAGNTCSVPVFIPGEGMADTEPPVCGQIAFESDGTNYEIVSSATDNVGIASVTVTRLTSNLAAFIQGNGPFDQGDAIGFDPVIPDVDLRARVTTFSGAFAFLVSVEDAAGNSAICDPVITDLAGALPEATSLGASYPNPANASGSAPVTVPFSLAETSEVRMEVYDVLGRSVAVLAEGVMDAGSYEVSWPEVSDLAPGTYIVRMTADGFAQTQRLTVVR